MLGNARDDDRHLKQIYDDAKKDHDSDHIPLEGNLSFRKTSRGEIEDRSAQRKPIKSFDQSKLVVKCSRICIPSSMFKTKTPHSIVFLQMHNIVLLRLTVWQFYALDVFKIYCADHTYTTLKLPMDTKVKAIIKAAQFKLGIHDKDLILCEVTSSGGMG